MKARTVKYGFLLRKMSISFRVFPLLHF
ncbi:rCG35187 [Rattus norvegicus]|uniref:RCG35187 n=1 Tax=Rattus norvegicus TaxID=10116 RepID=A6HEP1_RAT|nr:rCG35187 [Rattus norvegicus]